MNRNFNEIYKEISSKGFEEILNLKRIRNARFTLFLLAVILVMMFCETLIQFGDVIISVGLLFIIIAFISFMISDSKYKKTFKTHIMSKIINLYKSDFIYEPSKGITSIEYIAGFQDGFFTEFHSEDLIEGFIDDSTYFKMSQVTIIREDVEITSEGHRKTQKVTLFDGLYGMVETKDKILTPLEIKANKFFSRYSKNRIEIDSQEFEKQYDLFAENKVRAMEIFTSDVIDEINMLKVYTCFPIELKIQKNNIYFRIPCGEAFEAPLMKNANDYNTLYKYFRMIDSPLGIVEKLIKNANETQL